jgi:hypothetical protein
MLILDRSAFLLVYLPLWVGGLKALLGFHGLLGGMIQLSQYQLAGLLL